MKNYKTNPIFLYIVYTKITKSMKKDKTFNFRVHNEILEYLRIMANKNYTTVTGYIMDLIKKDMNKNVIDKRS